MRYAQIDKCDFCNGNNIGVSLFTQGCPFHCLGCHNPGTWDFEGGIEYGKATQKKILRALQDEYITRLSILGGEPLVDRNLKELSLLIDEVKELFPEKKIWVWTGFLFEQLVERAEENEYLKNILQKIDILIDGPFIIAEKDITLMWRGSANQRVIDMEQTRLSDEIVLYVSE